MAVVGSLLEETLKNDVLNRPTARIAASEDKFFQYKWHTALHLFGQRRCALNEDGLFMIIKENRKKSRMICLCFI